MPDEKILPPRSKSVYLERRHILLDSATPILEGAPKVYRAQTVKISGKHIAPSTDVWIIADTIEADPDSLLDVSGRNGSPSYETNDGAKNGAASGYAGQNADQSGRAPAGNGGKGGNVTLICRKLTGHLTIYSHGGRGGNGLNGGNGAKGASGTRGRERQRDFEAARGGRGKPGGAGGNGGPAGNGGDAGLIKVAASDSTMATITCSSLGGKAGTRGIGGRGGEGGDGGPGGDYGKTEPNGEPVGGRNGGRI